jgi:hypothetical protein
MKLVIIQSFPGSHYFITFGSTSSYIFFFKVSVHGLFLGKGPSLSLIKTGKLFQAYRKAKSDWRRHVCFRMEHRDYHWLNFRKISYLGCLLKFRLNLEKTTETLHKDLRVFVLLFVMMECLFCELRTGT